MDLNKPETIVGIINSAAILTTAGYFQYKTIQTDKKLSELSDNLTNTNDNLVDIDAKTEKLERDVDKLKRICNNLSRQLEQCKDVMTEQRETIRKLVQIENKQKISKVESDLFELNTYEKNEQQEKPVEQQKRYYSQQNIKSQLEFE